MVAIALMLALLALLLFASLRLEAALTERGGVLQLRWLGSRVAFDPRGRVLSGYLGGWRVFRRAIPARTPKPSTSPKKAQAPFRWQALVWAKASERGRLKALWQYLLRHLHRERFSLQLQLSTPDPALTGMLYGLYCASYYAFEPFWKEGRLRVEANFMEEWPKGKLDMVLRTRLVHLLVLGLRTWGIVRRLRGTPQKASVRYRPLAGV